MAKGSYSLDSTMAKGGHLHVHITIHTQTKLLDDTFETLLPTEAYGESCFITLPMYDNADTNNFCPLKYLLVFPCLYM